MILKVLFTELEEKDYCSFPSNLKKIKVGDMVLVETRKGKRAAIVDSINKSNSVIATDNKFIRFLSNSDNHIIKKNRTLSQSALRFAKVSADMLQLKMSFVSAEYTFDRKQLLFSFIAGSRIDFRELAKKLAQKYKTRIELKQIGVRDRASIVGGIGPCGLFLCCNTFLTEFNSVSISMAKNQMLALNPNKINGVCGRLLCCLNYENDFYTEARQQFINVNDKILYNDKIYKVIECNYINGTFNAVDKNNEVVKLDIQNGENCYEKIV